MLRGSFSDGGSQASDTSDTGEADEFTRLDFDGSYRLCWDSHNLYLHVQVSDPTPMRNTEQGDGLWNGGSRNSGDRTDWGVATLLK